MLGLHAIKEKPVAIDGKVEIRPVSTLVSLSSVEMVILTELGQMMYLALTYDHRMLDGREAVVFLVKVCVHSIMNHEVFNDICATGERVH